MPVTPLSQLTYLTSYQNDMDFMDFIHYKVNLGSLMQLPTPFQKAVYSLHMFTRISMGFLLRLLSNIILNIDSSMTLVNI
jgi:hypothetical protein